MNKTLSGKVALVTGAARGIGAAIARRLAQDGADVAISYVASVDRAQAIARELGEMGVRAAAFKADQADPVQIEGLIKAVVKHFGRLDILINNAGVFIMGKTADPATDLAAMERQFAINVAGAAAAVRAAAPHLGPGGRIISVGSAAADYSIFPGVADYAATKAAIAGYTRGWARDFGPRGITVNIVQPGPIDTDMNPDRSNPFADHMRAGTALGRYGKPEEVAAAVAFLASPEASYITGASLTVNGGFSA